MQLAADVHLPHARGDEPLVATIRSREINLPHARGDDHIKEKHDFTQRIWKQMRDLYQWVKGRALKQRD